MSFKSALAIVILVIFSLPAFTQDFNEIKSKADLAYMDKKYEEALPLYESIMNIEAADSSDMAMVYSYAGNCCDQLGEKEKAIDYFSEAVKLQVPQLMIYDKLINMTKEAKNNEIYEFALLQKLAAFPDFIIEINQKLAYLYYSTKQYEKLLPVTNSLTEWFPDYANYFLYNAIAKQNLKDVEGAMQAYEKVIALDPDNAGANMGKGMILYNKAMAMYDKLKNAYEALPNPDRVDYADYRKKIEAPKALFAEALPFLLKAFENKAYSSLKGVIRNSYLKLEEKENADKYL